MDVWDVVGWDITAQFVREIDTIKQVQYSQRGRLRQAETGTVLYLVKQP